LLSLLPYGGDDAMCGFRVRVRVRIRVRVRVRVREG
jgi:hypothetical protein